MSESATAAPAILGHNKGPVTPPTEQDMLDDLRARFPELDAKMEGFEKDLATYPAKLTLKDEDVAKGLQDLLADMKKHKTILGAHKKTEKGPWDKLVKVVQNFFASREEKVTALMEKWGPIHADFLQQKADEATRIAEERAAAKRAEAEAAERAAEEARQRAAEAEAREAAARKAEQEARERAEAEEARRKAAEEAKLVAEAEERRLAAERKERERAEKARNADNLKAVRQHMKRARALHDELQALETQEKDPDESAAAELDGLVRAGGVISALMGPVRDSPLLDDEQKALVEEIKIELGVMRGAATSRMDAKEKRRRKKLEKEAEAREAEQAQARREAREKQEREEKEARERRETAEREALEAKAREKDARGEVRAAAGEARTAFQDQKEAARDEKAHDTAADRHANAAGRIERKLDNSTPADLSRTRADLGSLGMLRRSWRHNVVDENLLRTALTNAFKADDQSQALSMLIAQLESTDFNGAAYRYMRLHQKSWEGRERIDDVLPGVVFSYEVDGDIRG